MSPSALRTLTGWLVLGTALHAQQRQDAQEPVQARPKLQETVTVTADRGLLDVADPASSSVELSGEALGAAPGLALDDALREVAGFQLFRRTSSWTANPTSQGVSLRGLGSTAASRTLVVSDQVPLNDPFGGWVHWNEFPGPAIQSVSLVRGGAADLYGSSAIGGVIEIVPVEAQPGPAAFQLAGDTSGATEDSALGDLLASFASRRLAALGAGSTLRTEGYIPTAPALRGAVDTPSAVASEVGRAEVRAVPLAAFLRGSVLREARLNGTPLQTNSTGLWRYAGGADLRRARSLAVVRLFGARETYAQSFSSIAADRNSERLTRLQRVPTDEAGLTLQFTRQLPRSVTAAAGFDLRDIRATDNETVVATGVTASTSARQRETGGFLDGIWQPRGWIVSCSVRVDSFRTFAGKIVTPGKVTPEPELDELVANPRVGLVRTLPHGLAVTATVFRAFRGPTLNELYRTSQVGSQTTLANNSLLAERATGFEFGAQAQTRFGSVRSSFFSTEVNRPVSAVSIAQTASTQTLQRENLGQIRSRGVMMEAQTRTVSGVDAALSYQFADATVTRFTPPTAVQPDITGLDIPQVPRQSFTSTANAAVPRVAVFHLFATAIGRQYDDAENQFLLHSFVRFDASAERALSRGLTLFASTQNLGNRAIEAGRTPNLTLASPRLVQAGLRFRFQR